MSETQAKTLLKARVAADAFAGIEYMRAHDAQLDAELRDLDDSIFFEAG